MVAGLGVFSYAQYGDGNFNRQMEFLQYGPLYLTRLEKSLKKYHHLLGEGGPFDFSLVKTPIEFAQKKVCESDISTNGAHSSWAVLSFSFIEPFDSPFFVCVKK